MGQEISIVSSQNDVSLAPVLDKINSPLPQNELILSSDGRLTGSQKSNSESVAKTAKSDKKKMDKPAEILLYDFLQEQVEALDPDDILYSLAVHDTVYQSMVKVDRALRISDTVSDFSPGPGMVMKEWDVDIVIVATSRILGKEKSDRMPAVEDVFAMQLAVYKLLFEQPTLGDRVCDTQPRRGTRGYDVIDSEPFAVAHIPLVINPSGARI